MLSCLFQSLGTRKNLDQLTGDPGLTGAVEFERQFVNQFAGIAGSSVHGDHPGPPFRVLALQQGSINLRRYIAWPW